MVLSKKVLDDFITNEKIKKLFDSYFTKHSSEFRDLSKKNHLIFFISNKFIMIQEHLMRRYEISFGLIRVFGFEFNSENTTVFNLLRKSFATYCDSIQLNNKSLCNCLSKKKKSICNCKRYLIYAN